MHNNKIEQYNRATMIIPNSILLIVIGLNQDYRFSYFRSKFATVKVSFNEVNTFMVVCHDSSDGNNSGNDNSNNKL